MADLVRGRYPITNELWSYLGQPVNATQSDVAVRTNLGMLPGALTDGSALATGVATAVPIPVEYGDVISKISVLAGATAESGGTHLWAALYSGVATPALLAQSADNTGATAVGASARFDFTLQTAQLITPANAPQGFVYASIMCAQSAGATPSLASITVATAVAYQWFTNSPVKMAAVTHGSSLVGTAPATIASPSAQAVTPIVFLS